MLKSAPEPLVFIHHKKTFENFFLILKVFCVTAFLKHPWCVSKGNSIHKCWKLKDFLCQNSGIALYIHFHIHSKLGLLSDAGENALICIKLIFPALKIAEEHLIFIIIGASIMCYHTVTDTIKSPYFTKIFINYVISLFVFFQASPSVSKNWYLILEQSVYT